jgi:hypothetical protein
MSQKAVAVAGVDLFVEAHFGVDLPLRVGAFALKNISSRGTTVTAKDAGAILDVGWVCARYLLSDKSITGRALDAEVGRLLAEVGKEHTWSSLVKLYEFDGTKAYTG